MVIMLWYGSMRVDVCMFVVAFYERIIWLLMEEHDDICEGYSCMLMTYAVYKVLRAIIFIHPAYDTDEGLFIRPYTYVLQLYGIKYTAGPYAEQSGYDIFNVRFIHPIHMVLYGRIIRATVVSMC